MRAEGRARSHVEAAEALRALIDEISLVPENGLLEIKLAGALAGILALTSRTARSPPRLEAGFSK